MLLILYIDAVERCLDIDIRLKAPDGYGEILPCLRNDDGDEADMAKLIVLFQRIAFSLQIWTQISFITRSEFIAYRPPRVESSGTTPQLEVVAEYTDSSKSTPRYNAQTTAVSSIPESLSVNNTPGPLQVNNTPGPLQVNRTPAPLSVDNTPAPPKYNSRSSTIGRRQEYSDSKSESKEDKEAKIVSNLKSKVVALELENKELKASQKKKLEEIKTKTEEAKAKTEQKFEEKEIKTNQKLEVAESKLQYANSKIEELTKEIKVTAAKSAQIPKLAPAIATNSAGTEASAIASEYLKLTSVIQNTETQIISNRLKAETSIALLREEETQKLKVFFMYIKFIMSKQITINFIFEIIGSKKAK